ncbi:MAG: CHAT domain-containing protein [Chloroflexota bacterium]
MANSYAQTEDVTCPNCQHTWSANIWLLVDVDERPDLAGLARSEKWQNISCQNCDQALSFNAPLLLFWPSSTLPLTFFAAANQTQNANEQAAQFLIDTLYEQLGSSQWQDEWLERFPTLPVAFLPILLGLPPENAHLLWAITQLQHMANWQDVRTFLDQTPIVLETWVDEVYDQIITALRQHDGDSARDYVADQELLRLCRSEGIVGALFDLTELLPAPLDEQVKAAQAKIEASAEEGLPNLNRAIEMLLLVQQDPEFTKGGGQSQGIVTQNLGMALFRRYRTLGNRVDLDEAIDYLETAVRVTPKASFANYALSQRTLAQALEERYRQTSRGSDLDQAVAAHEAAVAATLEEPAYLAEHLNSYARLLRERYGRGGSLDDLEQAITAWQNLVNLVDEAAPQAVTYLNNLANAYREFYRRNGNDAFLREAVAIHKQIVDLQPDSTGAQVNLANAYMDEFWRFGYTRELDKAIAGYEQALQLLDAPEEAAGVQHNLAKALQLRADLTGNVDDFISAWQLLSPIIKQTSAEAPDYPSLLNTLGTIMQSVYERSSDETYLHAGIEAYWGAAKTGLERKTSLVLSAIAPNWGNWAAERSSWAEAAVAYGYGLEAAERLYRQQLERTAKELWLRDAQTLPGLAAFALAKTGDYASAILPLEQGRARLLGEALRRDPANLSRLSQGQHRSLYEQYVNIVQEIEALELTPSKDDGSVVDKLRELRRQLNDVIVAIQEIPEFTHFLSQPSLPEITAALTEPLAENGQPAIGVYITITSLGGVALLVHAQSIEPVWLEMDSETLEQLLRGPYREEDAQRAEVESAAIEALIGAQLPPEYRLKRVDPVFSPESDTIAGGYLGGQLGISDLQAAIAETLVKIGETIVQPIAERLETIVAAANGATPTVIMISTGKLGLLPLHAAPYQSANGQTQTLLDRYVTLFTPDAESLLVARRRIHERRSTQALLTVIDPTNTLPYAKLEQEVVTAHFDRQATTILADETARREVVIAHVAGQEYLHFACHGFYDWDKVMDSGLLLADATALQDTVPLTLRDMLQPTFSLAQSRLVVLSACETGLSEFRRTPDEYVGLPAALLQAGAPAVISTLWAVNDLSTSLLMKQFYEAHITHGLAPAAALRQAQLWLQEVSAGELADYFAAKRKEQAGPSSVISAAWRRFAAEKPKSRPFAHPYYWAPFTFMGA